jgi:hypothetical protein
VQLLIRSGVIVLQFSSVDSVDTLPSRSQEGKKTNITASTGSVGTIRNCSWAAPIHPCYMGGAFFKPAPGFMKHLGSSGELFGSSITNGIDAISSYSLRPSSGCARAALTGSGKKEAN